MTDILKLLLKDTLWRFVDNLFASDALIFENRAPDAADYVPMDDEAVAEFIHDYTEEQEFKSCYSCHRAEMCVVYYQIFCEKGLTKLYCTMRLEDGEAVRHIVANAIGARCMHHVPSQDSEDAS